jgi:hypothetical protein
VAFTPNDGLTLAQAAQQTGFTSFNWQQTVTSLPGPSPFSQVGNPVNLTAPPSFLDPPLGGYNYCINYFPACLTSYPFYPTTQTADTLTLFDSPQDGLLPAGSQIAFKDDLIGILPGFTSNTNCLNLATPTCVDLGVGVSWTSNYDGTFGGISVTASNQPIDPATADGLGGITITDIEELTNYSPFGVTTVNGNPILMLPTDTNTVPEPKSIAILASSLIFFMLLEAKRKRSR